MLTDKAYLTLTSIASAIIIVFMVVEDVPWWVGFVICVPVIVGGLIVKRQYENNRRRYVAPQQVQYQPPPPPPPPMSTGSLGLALPSAHQDYRFLLNATVLWRQSGVQHSRPAQLAVDAIRERATRFTESESPANTDLLAPRLAADLSLPRPDPTGHLEVWAQDVLLSIPDDDRRRLERIAEVRKNEEVWEHERTYERNKRAYLREDVLSSTGSAVVWWLAQDTTRVRETVGLIGTFAQLVAAARERHVEPGFMTGQSSDDAGGPSVDEGDVVDRLMATMLPGGSEPERADLADRLARLAAEAGATDLARTIRERFNAPDFTEVPEPAVHPNGQGEPT